MTKVSNVPLKYLYTATYEDGSTYVQTADDKSIFEPDTRSCFTDVLRLAEKKRLISFVLKQITEDGSKGDEYGVDLRDGHFEINGVAFRMHEYPISDIKLVYFRQHKVDFLQSRTADTEISHNVVYRMGWQATVTKPCYCCNKTHPQKSYQEIMQID